MRNWESRQVISDENFELWFQRNYTKYNRYLYILGIGFDQRMCSGISRFKRTGLSFDVLKIYFNEGAASPSRKYKSYVEKNEACLNDITKDLKVMEKRIDFWTKNSGESGFEEKQSRFVGEINASKMIKEAKDIFAAYTDIILDISALPQAIYLCIMNALFKYSAENQRLNIIVNENYSTDIQIEPRQAEETAHELHGFASPSDDVNNILIWFPVLGEKNIEYINKYYNFLRNPLRDIAEICPVVPFPAVNVRRADDIIAFYSKDLFDVWRIEKRSIIYASETNPLLIRQNLYETSLNYATALSPLGTCKFVFSAITSKIMTVGMFLAAFDLKFNGINISILSISNKGYKIKEKSDKRPADKLICLAV